VIRSWAGRVFPWLAWLYVASLLIQVFLAGLGVFVDPATFRIHVDFGRNAVGLLTLLLPIVAWLGRLPSVRLAVGVLLFYLLQTGLPEVRASYPVVAALHPVLALILFWLSVRLASHARRRAFPAESTNRS
jgi:putative tricarboxylic transport membrane protein